MSIRALFDKWMDSSLNFFPQGSLFPTVLPRSSEEFVDNEDGTVTYRTSFTPDTPEQGAAMKAAVEAYLEELKSKGALFTYEVSLGEDGNSVNLKRS